MILKMANPPIENVPTRQRKRLDELCKAFENIYKKQPHFVAHAPGRVNIIGEHIDYCGYAVLPMAIEQDITIAICQNNDHRLRLRNVTKRYEDFECCTKDVHIDKTNPKWQHYFLCGYKGVITHYSMEEGVGIDMLVEGTVPSSAGLSSSSAFVCSAALATMHANKKMLTKLELAHICQHCEYFIGTEGGGMDQSISFLAEPGTAKLIEFNPIRATDVKLPHGAVFVISNSCAEINKAATSHFNTRVAECRLAAQILAKKSGLDWQSIKRLGDLQTKLKASLKDMLSKVSSSLHSHPYSKAEICDLLEVTCDELNELSLSERTYEVKEFKLHDRAKHVYSEANRVLEFKALCDQQGPNALQQLGQLMFDSHISCKDDYECSCQELDELVQLAKDSGALGSRLTGAGWGGCVVSLVPADLVTSFVEKMKQGFYEKSDSRRECVDQALFVTQPGGGAGIYTV